MEAQIKEVDRRVISFYQSRGRSDYEAYKSLPSEQQTKQNKGGLHGRVQAVMSLREVHAYLTDPDHKTGYHSYNNRIFYAKGETKTLQELTSEIRKCTGDDRRDAKYFLSDHVGFSGVPGISQDKNGRERQWRAAKYFESQDAVLSGYINIDIDHLPAQGKDLNEVRAQIENDRQELGLLLLFVSPSGDGLKLVCKSKQGYDRRNTVTGNDKIDCQRVYLSYLDEFNALKNYIEQKFNIVADSAIQDICRTCYLCYAPDAVLYEDNTGMFDSSLHPVPVVPVKQKETTNRERVHTAGSSAGSYYGQGEYRPISEIVDEVVSNGIDLTYDADEGTSFNLYLSLVCSFAALGEEGRIYLHRALCNPKYNADDANFRFDYVRSHGYSLQIGTFTNMCKDAGIRIYSTPERTYDRQEFNSISNSNNTLKMAENTQIPQSPEVENVEFSEEELYAVPKGDFIHDIVISMKPGISTPLKIGNFDNYDKNKLRAVQIPRQGYTIIAARSGHGKTLLLRNLVVYLARDNKEEGDVLFFEFEESKTEITVKLLSTFIGQQIHTATDERSNCDTIIDLEKENKIFGEEGVYERKKIEFLNLVHEHKLVIRDDAYTADKLVRFVESYNKGRKVKAVFIDHIHRLPPPEAKEGKKNQEKRLDYNDIAVVIKEFAKNAQIPFIVAAQFSKGANNPLSMSSGDISESINLAQNADLVLCLWNSEKSYDIKDKQGYTNTDKEKMNKINGYTDGVPGKLFIQISKNRQGQGSGCTVVDFDGDAGVIDFLTKENKPKGAY